MRNKYIWGGVLFSFLLFSFSIDFEDESQLFPVRIPDVISIFCAGLSTYSFIFFKRDHIHGNEIFLSAIYAFFMLVGRAFVSYYWNEWHAHLNISNFVRWTIAYAGFFIICISIVNIVFTTIQKHKHVWISKSKSKSVFDKHPFFLTFVLLLIMHLPAIILCFPGIPNEVDTGLQISMAFAKNEHGELTLINNHPIAHTLLMGGCIRLGIMLFTSETLGMGIYYLFQVLFSLVCYSLAISFLTELGINQWIRFGIIIFLGLNPVLSNWLTCLTKDILFTDILLLFIISITRMILNNRVDILALFSGIGIILMRNEGILTLLSLMFGLLFVNQWSRRIAIKGIFLFTSIYFCLTQVLFPFFNIAQGSLREPLSLPIQMVCRYVIGHDNELTSEEKEIIASIINYDGIFEFYDHNSVDSIKSISRWDLSSDDVHSFLILWLKLGIKHPLTYIDAFLDMKDQFMYPSRITGVYSYSSNRIVSEYTVYDYKYAESSGIHITFPQSLEKARIDFENFRTYLQMQPVIKLLCISTTYVWLALGMVFYFAGKHDKTHLPYSLLVVFLVICMFLGPRDGDYFRYAYPVACILPFIFLIALRLNTKSAISEKKEVLS